MKIEMETSALDRQDFIRWVKEGIGSGDLQALLKDLIDNEFVVYNDDGDLVPFDDVNDEAVEDFAKILADYLVG